MHETDNLFNPLAAMDAYIRPAKAISSYYRHKRVLYEGFYGLLYFKRVFGNCFYRINPTLAETTYLVTYNASVRRRQSPASFD